MLAVLATPIGNLSDLSERAVTALREADLVLAEDTRRTRALLSHLAIKGKPLERMDAEVESRGVERWLAMLEAGQQLVLVSDAGTPSLSDPGATLIREAAARGLSATPIPGPSAITAALSVSGFDGGHFRFVGFVPRGTAARRGLLGEVARTTSTVVLFESPKRLAATLRALAELVPERPAMVARELTKAHEELVRGTLSQLASDDREWRGEITLVLGPGEESAVALTGERLYARIKSLLSAGMRARDAAKALALESGMSASEAYAAVTEYKRRQDS